MIFLGVLAVFAIATLGVVQMNTDGRKRRELAVANKRLRATLREVEVIARTNYELEPRIAQCILDEVNKERLKELE